MEEIFHKPAKNDWQTQLLRSGVVSAEEFSEVTELRAFLPHPELRNKISHYWILRWDLPDGVVFKPREVLSDPVVTLFVTRSGSFVYGITPDWLQYQAQGCDVIAGVTFLPAGFSPYWKRPMHQMPTGKLSLADVLPEAAPHLGPNMLNYADDVAISRIFDDYFRSIPVKCNRHITAIHDIVRKITAEPQRHSVAALSREFGIPERTLQHIFREEVGTSLKWIIKRSQLLDALTGSFLQEAPDWSEIAYAYNFSSQAHFIRDFKKVFGMPPDRFHKAARINTE
ncbi:MULTISPECIES: AraC family transcriptional regulator [Rheinheimera]|uniref:Helix-turn-helix domain-containing protein n=1 Tax=Rheinheimera aquimaris TaxID=412437 RepID=A0ABN1DBZ5_9GAMM|nr:AraC family transcriptional regulator [Rheinheimera aquimaris]MCB5212485.1 AraC family transcriptional regulator [Rheinheimera aquimaris]